MCNIERPDSDYPGYRDAMEFEEWDDDGRYLIEDDDDDEEVWLDDDDLDEI